MRNKQNAFRRNKYPTEALLRNGHIICGVCHHVMRVMNYKQKMADGSEVLKSYYRCDRDTGSDDPLYNHFVAANVQEADRIAWDFAVKTIRCPGEVEKKVAKLRKKFQARNDLPHVQTALDEVKRKIANLLETAMAATDEDTIALCKVNLTNLEKEKHGLQVLYNEVSEEHDVYSQVQGEVDKFLAWCEKTRPLLDDPDFRPTWDEKRMAIQILGVLVTCWPMKGDYPDRYTVDSYPPGIIKSLTVNGILKNSPTT